MSFYLLFVQYYACFPGENNSSLQGVIIGGGRQKLLKGKCF